MVTKVVSGLIIVLALSLVVGTGYLLFRPADVATVAARGQQRLDGGSSGERGAGNQQRILSDVACEAETCFETAGVGQGLGQGQGGSQGGGRGNSGAGAQGAGRLSAPIAIERVAAWETLSGRVTAVDSEMLVETAGGEVLVGLGQAWYRDEAGFVISVGDEVTVTGFWEDGEFKAGEVENHTTAETLILRDETGRPMWAGQGQRQNQVGF